MRSERCPDNSGMLSGCCRNQCPDVTGIRINGLGSAVAEVLVENLPVPMERVGAQDEFGEVGPQDYLMKRFNLTSKTIYEKAKHVISRK